MFGAACKNAEYIPITDEMKKWFLKGHNEKRNLIAQGKLGGVFEETASRMATIVSLLKTKCIEMRGKSRIFNEKIGSLFRKSIFLSRKSTFSSENRIFLWRIEHFLEKIEFQEEKLVFFSDKKSNSYRKTN